MKEIHLISKTVIEPIIKSNIQYVNSISDFEGIELEYNETILCFDNNNSCFYIKERDRFGEYSPIKVFFYEDFSTRMKNDDDAIFYERCKALKFDTLKTEIAYKFFIKNEKVINVWLWLLESKKAKWEYDTVKHLKYKMKKQFLSLENKN